MKLNFLFLLLPFAALTTHAADSGFNGTLNVTAIEFAQHFQLSEELSKVAASCVESTYEFHREFYSDHGISPFYGDRSRFGKLSYREQKSEFKRRGWSVSLLEQMRPLSCVGLALGCLEEGFHATGQDLVWNRVKAFVRANGQDGLALQHALQKLGWKVLYWNPNTRNNEDWDDDERSNDEENRKKFWGYHSYHWYTVTKSAKYDYNKVDDAKLLVDFGTRLPAEFRRVPFFVGTAHGGYHVFPGTFGRVIEAHSTREITDPNEVESAEFNPLRNGGAPHGHYYSGLMAIPPSR